MSYTMTMRLSPQQRRLLDEVLATRDPRLAHLCRTAALKLSVEERHEICTLIAEELADYELDEDDEPTARGLALEDLLDRVNPAGELGKDQE